MTIIALNSFCFTPQYSEPVEYDDDEDYYSAEDDSDSDDDLPKSYKTLLKSASANYTIENIKNGEFVYFGVEKGLLNLNFDLHKDGVIDLIINCDGMPIYRYSSKQMWPILAKVFHKSVSYDPFPIALFYGDSKPGNLETYSEKFIEEMNKLGDEGIVVVKKRFLVRIKCFTRDTPARKLLKGIKSHVGFYSCERCTIKGVRFEGTILFPPKDDEERTDTSFRNKSQPEHHTSDTPLIRFDPSINLITSFLIDSMHLCCLGVMKKLEYWLEKSKRKLSYRQRVLLGKRSENISTQVPIEYQRKTRSLLRFFGKLKGTEFRFILLYSGPVILRKLLPKHFTKICYFSTLLVVF